MTRTLTLALILPALAAADPPQVNAVRATATGAVWRIDVTLTHPDTGWDHYADGWRVLDAAGNEIGLRTLAHPHVDEQPFTRSLTGLSLPVGTTRVSVEPRCSIDGWSGIRTPVALP